ncbi:hypothetical protein EHE19_007780 [Ruminiclostridium herbifermentans]|uniref:Uncharacterized protein n=1 Tax=Ruminiclostridium herbifermentans TaxID=2488810 RepID=A0A4U7JLR0_9FIRM|nr:MFS transporter [Ruminiclostridium herbifermentans]QNU68296.1 hypothetical protein EHE19_007780 [Ruminiclostridium herbifermentans]
MDEQNNIQEESLAQDNNINSVESEVFSANSTLEAGFSNSENTEAQLNGNRTSEEAPINSHNTANNKAINNEALNNYEVLNNRVSNNEALNNEVSNNEVSNNEVSNNEVLNNEVLNNEVLNNRASNNEAYYNSNNILNKEAVYRANNAANKETYLNGGMGRRYEANPQAYNAMGNQAYNNQISALERQMLLNYNNPLNVTSLSNWTKVMLTALVVLIPGIGQIVGIIFGLVFIANDRDADRRSYGGALITVSVISFIISAIFWFLLAISFGPDLYY